MRFAPLPRGRQEDVARATDDRAPWRSSTPPPPPARLGPLTPATNFDMGGSPGRNSEAYRRLRDAYVADLTRTGTIGEEDLPEEDEDTCELRMRVRGF